MFSTTRRVISIFLKYAFYVHKQTIYILLYTEGISRQRQNLRAPETYSLTRESGTFILLKTTHHQNYTLAIL
jgi:hypothetical protein